MLSSSSASEVLAQVSGEIRCIIAGPIDEGRLASAHEGQPQDIHPRCGDHAAIVTDAPFAIEHGYVEPGDGRRRALSMSSMAS